MGRTMKDSGVEWIGEIPEGWETIRIKNCCWLKGRIGWQGLNSTEYQDEGPYLITGKDFANGGVNWDSCVHISDERYEEDADIHVKEDDLLITKDGTVGKLAIVKDAPAKVSLNSGILLIRNVRSFKYDQKFLYYALSSDQFSLWYELNQTGNSTIRHLYQEQFYNFEFAYPSIEEQTRIATYLDKRCRNIDTTIDKTTSSIEEYKKLKQAIITQAVTKGVRSVRPMKDSGVEWIGEIPEEWRVTQLRHCALVKSGITLGKTYPAGTELVEMPYLRVANVQDGHVDLSGVTTLEVTRDEVEKYSLREGSVLMTEGGDRDKLGRGCVWDGSIAPCLHQNHIFAVDTDRNVLDPYFLSYLTTSRVGRDYFDVTAVKTTNLACTSSSKVLAYVIPLPDAAEQNEIVGYLDTKCAAVDALIAQKQQLFTELQNYKKSLIYEYVTGKKEVPAV